MHNRVQPYVRAGIPEEFYDMLLWEEERLDLEETTTDGVPTQRELTTGRQEFIELYKRYKEWRQKTDKEIEGQE